MGSFRVLLSSILYFIGTFLLNPACLLLLPFGNETAGIMILICACSYLTVAAGLDAFYALCLETNENDPLQKLNTMFMLLGGVLFLTASVLYLPSLDNVLGLSASNLGTWVFRIGSCSYLGGSFTSLYLLNQPLEHEYKYASLTSQDDNYYPTGSAPLLTPTKHHIGDSISEPRRSRCTLSTRAVWLLVIYNYIFGALAYIAGGVLTQFFDGTCRRMYSYSGLQCICIAETGIYLVHIWYCDMELWIWEYVNMRVCEYESMWIWEYVWAMLLTSSLYCTLFNSLSLLLCSLFGQWSNMVYWFSVIFCRCLPATLWSCAILEWLKCK